jgi:hypothetical protein
LQGRKIAESAMDALSPLQGVAQVRQALGIPQLLGGGPPLPVPQIPFQSRIDDPIMQTIRDAGGPDMAFLYDEDVDAIDTLSSHRNFSHNEDQPDFTQDELERGRKRVYEVTQKALANMPKEITVYRLGDLPNNQVKSFTIDPNYAFTQHLPWADRLGGKMQTYRVRKEAILAAPDAFIRPHIGELEVLINTNDVQAVGD